MNKDAYLLAEVSLEVASYYPDAELKMTRADWRHMVVDTAIDIIAGHLGPKPVSSIAGEPVSCNKDFQKDSSRIYISQKSKIDEYFGV